MTIDEFLPRLSNIKRTSSGRTARCPAHADAENSLSIDPGDVPANCFSGCATDQAVRAMGLSMRDLCPARPAVRIADRDPSGIEAAVRCPSSLVHGHERSTACASQTCRRRWTCDLMWCNRRHFRFASIDCIVAGQHQAPIEQLAWAEAGP